MAYENGIQRNRHSDIIRHKEIQKKRHMKAWWVYFTGDFDTFCEFEQKRHEWTDDKYYKGYWRIDGAGSRRRAFREQSNSKIRSQEKTLNNLKGLTLDEVENFEDDLINVVCSSNVLNRQINKWMFFDW